MIDYLDFGEDISKVRSRLPKNLAIIKRPEFIQEVRLMLEEIIAQTPAPKNNGKKISPLAIAFFLEIFRNTISPLLDQIINKPYRINLINPVVVEFLYVMKYLDKRNPFNYLLSSMMQTVNLDHEKWLEAEFKRPLDAEGTSYTLLRNFVEIPSGSSDYNLFFTYTLRQTNLHLLSEFLKEKQKSYHGDFLEFLDLILLDDPEDKIIPLKHKEACRLWINKEVSFRTEIEKAMQLFPTGPVPDGWVSIPGSFDRKQIIKFFSFLYLETDDNGNSLLSKADTTELLNFGFAYPEKKQFSLKMFSLQTSKQLPKSFVSYMFYHLFEHNKPFFLKQNRKKHFALFLKHRFTNFSEQDLKTILNSIRDRKPKGLGPEFKLEKYLGS